jgi:isopropylmalate/homocitrate/citramalate synthase
VTENDGLITICEVGPRDGLQNETRTLSVLDRVELIDRLSNSGARRVEAVSFVNPRRVPQMADAEQVMAGIRRRDGTTYAGLVLNVRGAERAIVSRVDVIHFALAATDTFNRRNQGVDTRESLREFSQIVRLASAQGIPCNATIAVAFGCPFEGAVRAAAVWRLARELHEIGATEITLADTIGVGIPDQVTALFVGLRAFIGAVKIGGHFHNSRNTGLANAYASVQAGASVLDASIGGIGGCPFAPRATGNVPTEDLIFMLGSKTERTIDLEALLDVGVWLERALGHPLPGMLMRAGLFPNRDGAASAR